MSEDAHVLIHLTPNPPVEVHKAAIGLKHPRLSFSYPQSMFFSFTQKKSKDHQRWSSYWYQQHAAGNCRLLRIPGNSSSFRGCVLSDVALVSWLHLP